MRKANTLCHGVFGIFFGELALSIECPGCGMFDADDAVILNGSKECGLCGVRFIVV